MASKFSVTDMLARVLRSITTGTPINGGTSVATDFTAGIPIKAVKTPVFTHSVTGVGQSFPINVSGLSSVAISLHGTFSGVAVSFEVSVDSTTGSDGYWISIPAFRTSGPGSTFELNTSPLSAASSYGWLIPVSAFSWFRLRSTAWTSGTAIFKVSASSEETPQVIQSVDTEITYAATLVDGFTNPSAGHVAGDQFNFNGATWDRARNNANVVTGDTGAKTATFSGATQTNYNARGALITILMGTVTGTAPTCVPQLQWSPDGGTTWINYGPAMAAISATGNYTFLVYPTNFSQTAGATPANLTTGATQTVAINSVLPRTWRLVYTIGGTTPSFTISSVQVNYVN